MTGKRREGRWREWREDDNIPAGHQFGNLGPAIAQARVQIQNILIFLFRPRVLANIGIEMIVPTVIVENNIRNNIV
jgi:hypothetical protein